MNVVFVVGTTASGKSEYALKRAQKNSAAIINCDSVQIYQGLKIGSALPTPEEMALVPHFLYSYIPKGEKSTAGQYSREFYSLMDQLKDDYPEVIVVGGTGFYFQAIEKGMFDVGGENPELRESLTNRLRTEAGALALYEELKVLDPVAAERIFPKDHYRLVRAMELMLTLGKSLTQIQKEFESSKKEFPWPLEKIGIQVERELLLKRVEARTQKMLKQGLIDEVEQLRKEGFRSWAPMESVGYKEVNSYLDASSEIKNLQQLQERIVIGTMQLAKKQRTWFKRDVQIGWLG